jgi:tRNA A-37 threonylcarbamoyl transferase component Bud32
MLPGLSLLFNWKKAYQFDQRTVNAQESLIPDPGRPVQYVALPHKSIPDEKTCWEAVAVAGAGKSFKVRRDQKLGSGYFATAYTACADATDCQYIAKVSKFKTFFGSIFVEFVNFQREVFIAALAGEIGCGPKVYAAYTCDKRNQGVIIMDKINAVATEALSPEQTQNLVQKVNLLHEAGILHQDLALRNVLVTANRCWIIDYGLAVLVTQPMLPALEAYDTASLFYELLPVSAQYMQQALKGFKKRFYPFMYTSILTNQANEETLHRWFPTLTTRDWLIATRWRYKADAKTPFYDWSLQDLHDFSLELPFPDSLGYVETVLQNMSPAVMSFYATSPQALMGVFMYTIQRTNKAEQDRLIKYLTQYQVTRPRI